MLAALAFLWAGLVIGVSFLATPIKFRAKSLTLPVALDVGRATFHAFGKVEWLLSMLLVISMLSQRGDTPVRTVDWLLAGGAIAIVAAQATWLIPRLDVRVAAIIAGEQPPKSHLHTVFAGLEFVKLLTLFIIGTWTASHLA